MEGNRTLTLALVWQLMRAYTLALLAQLNSDNTPIVESEIIAWANHKLEEKGVTIRHFQDKVMYNPMFLVQFKLNFTVSTANLFSKIIADQQDCPAHHPPH